MPSEMHYVATGKRFKVHAEAYEVRLIKTDERTDGAFAEVLYEGERTLVSPILDESEAYGHRAYSMISFVDDLSLDLVGLLASVSNALAERGVPIFVISSYRTDHLLVLQEHLGKTLAALESLGMTRQ